MKEIEYYVKENGRCPYKDWLNSLDKSTRVHILARVNRLVEDENYGNHRKLVNNSLSELKFTIGKGYRIYYIDLDDVLILFLAAGDKSNQKEDAIKAQEYYNDYIERSRKNEK